MTDCPNGLKQLPVSTTVRPVTQTADVDVNSASTNPSPLMVDAGGSISKQVPIRIISANPKMVARAGERSNVRTICMIMILSNYGISVFMILGGASPLYVNSDNNFNLLT